MVPRRSFALLDFEALSRLGRTDAISRESSLSGEPTLVVGVAATVAQKQCLQVEKARPAACLQVSSPPVKPRGVAASLRYYHAKGPVPAVDKPDAVVASLRAGMSRSLIAGCCFGQLVEHALRAVARKGPLFASS